MGKKKKVTEKVKLFYRGPVKEPTKVVDENEMKVIVAALKEYHSIKNDQKAWSSTLSGQKIFMKFNIGLKSTLRSLKHKKAKAVIYDDTASAHLTKYLIEFCHKLNIPVIQAHRLIDHARTIKLQTLLAMTIEEVITKEEELSVASSTPALNDLCALLFDKIDKTKENSSIEGFQSPVISRVPVSGKSKAKKDARKAIKRVMMDAAG